MITNDDALASKMTMIKNFGRKSGGIDVFETFGLNIKFTDIQAVIGIEQMKKLPGRIVFLRNLYRQYYDELHEIMIKPSDTEYLPWFIDVYTERRDELASFLKMHNIQTRPTYPEVHRTPMYLSDATFPNSSFVAANGLFLPSHTLLTDGEVKYICKLIKIFLSTP